jgi:Protein of unknown function (DUF998)
VATSLILIWGTRFTVPRPIYVSELGAEGEPTAAVFEVALLTLVSGTVAIGWAGRHIRSTARLLRHWAPSGSLWVSSAGFLLSSQVTCTAGCPLPVGVTFTWQDLIHTTAAVLSFAAACIAMLQVAFAVGYRGLARLSMGCGVAVAVIAAIGGILSLLRLGTDVGSALELIATSIAMGWLVIFGLVIARADRSDADPVSLSIGRGERDVQPRSRPR